MGFSDDSEDSDSRIKAMHWRNFFFFNFWQEMQYGFVKLNQGKSQPGGIRGATPAGWVECWVDPTVAQISSWWDEPAQI